MSNVKRGLACVMVMFLLITLFMAGCGVNKGASDEKTSKAVETTQSTQETKPALVDKVTLTYWTHWDNTDIHYPATTVMFENFRKNNPDIDLKIEEMPYLNLAAKLTTSLAAGEGPDIMHINSNLMNEAGRVPGRLWAKNGKLLDLTPYLEKDVEWKSLINPAAFEELNYEGKIYAVPVEVSYVYQIYNKELLEKTGMQYPQTWEDVIALAKKLKEMGFVYTVWGGNECWMPITTYFYLLEGIPGARSDWDKAIAGEGSFNTPAIKEMFTKLQEFIKNGGVDPKDYSMSNDESCNLFGIGKALTISNGEWCYGWIRDMGTGVYDKIDIGLWPAVNGVGPMYSTWVYTCEGLNANLANDKAKLEAGLKFLKMMNSKESAIISVEKAQTGTGTLIDPEKDVPDLNPLMKKNFTIYKDGKHFIKNFGKNYAEDAIKNAMLALQMGKSIDEIVAQMDKAVKDEIAQRNK